MHTGALLLVAGPPLSEHCDAFHWHRSQAAGPSLLQLVEGGAHGAHWSTVACCWTSTIRTLRCVPLAQIPGSRSKPPAARRRWSARCTLEHCCLLLDLHYPNTAMRSIGTDPRQQVQASRGSQKVERTVHTGALLLVAGPPLSKHCDAFHWHRSQAAGPSLPWLVEGGAHGAHWSTVACCWTSIIRKRDSVEDKHKISHIQPVRRFGLNGECHSLLSKNEFLSYEEVRLCQTVDGVSP